MSMTMSSLSLATLPSTVDCKVHSCSAQQLGQIPWSSQSCSSAKWVQHREQIVAAFLATLGRWAELLKDQGSGPSGNPVAVAAVSVTVAAALVTVTVGTPVGLVG